MHSVRFRAYVDSSANQSERLALLGAEIVGDEVQKETYFHKDILTGALGQAYVLEKRRITYKAEGWTAHLDALADDVHCLEIESPAPAGSTTSVADRVRRELGISPLDVLPWSYGELSVILARAAEYRAALGDELRRVVFLDGASGAGKSSVSAALRDRFRDEFAYVPRCTTRPPRPREQHSGEYIHLSADTFKSQEAAGEFVEARDFLFGMSYGLRWLDVASMLQSTRCPVFGLVNLGTARHLRVVAPAATRVLLTAPLETLRARLVARGTHDAAALDERLENAAHAASVAGVYDHVVENLDGSFDATVDTVAEIIRGRETARAVG